MVKTRRSLIVIAALLVTVLLGAMSPAGAQDDSSRFGRGDNFYAPIRIPASWAWGNLSANNFNATKQVCEPNHAAPGGASVWFLLPAHNHWDRVTVSTNASNFDTTLAVYRGNNLCALTRIAANDDINYPVNKRSRVVFNARPGVAYRIAVDGYRGPSTGGVVARGSIGLQFRRVMF